MLQAIRRGTGSWILKGFLILIAISFVTWGIGDMFRGPQDPVVASVGGYEIRARQLVREVNDEVERLRSLTGGAIDMEAAREAGIVEQTLEMMIARVLVDIEANSLGMAIDDEQVRAQIRANPAFRNELGVFDPRLFQLVLSRSGLSEEGYVNALRRDLARAQLIGSIASGVTVPDNMARAVFQHREERRAVDAVVVRSADVADAPIPNASQIETYYRENADRFTAPEYRTLTYIDMRPADLIDTVDVSQAEIEREFEIRRDRYDFPERREIDHLFFADQESAEQAYQRLLRGDGFETVAAASTEVGEDISLGSLTRNQLPREVADDVFALNAGSISVPLETGLGWNIYRVNEVMPAESMTLDQVRDEIRKDIATEYAIDALLELSHRLEDLLAGGASLEEAAEQLDLNLGHVPAVDRRGLGRDGAPAEELPGIPNFIEVAFDTPEGLESQLAESAVGNIMFVVRVDEVIEPAIRPLAEVREQGIAGWQEEWRRQRAGEIAVAIAEQARADGDLAAAAAAHGFEVQGSTPFSRDGRGLDLPLSDAGVAEVFTLGDGEVSSALAGDGGTFVVAELRSVIAPDYASADDRRNAVRQSLVRNLENDLLAAYESALRNRHSIRIKRDVVESYF